MLTSIKNKIVSFFSNNNIKNALLLILFTIIMAFGIRGCMNDPSRDLDLLSDENKSLKDSIEVILKEKSILKDSFDLSVSSENKLRRLNDSILAVPRKIKYIKLKDEIQNAPLLGDPVVDSMRAAYWKIDSTRHTIRGSANYYDQIGN